jgi:hypothetical protein
VSGRLVSTVTALALLGLGGALLIGCYTVPRPDCGFVCGPDDACPDGYTCADDHRCHRAGAADVVCAPLDAPPPADAAIDGPDARP